MKKRIISLLLCVVMAAMSLAACGKKDTSTTDTKTNTESGSKTDASKVDVAQPNTAEAEKLGYTFGKGETFHSDEPVTYSMFFSDASWYPMTEQWKTDGVFAEITKRTNVTLDITSIDSGDYNEKTKLAINGGSSSYIIPKVYDEAAFVDGGAVVAVSDYTQYMPNFTYFYDTYNMKADVDTIVRADGKFYRLPGMHEMAIQDYTIIVRDDIFKAAGYDVAELEKTWTWESLYDVLVGVKAYMVGQGMCSESDYIWSDLWCGSESGQNSGGNLLKIIANSYGVKSGWAVGDGMSFDAANDEWVFSSTTPEFKQFVTLVNKYVKGGILDPETFTQDDTTATSKFYRGETVIQSVNRGQLSTFITGLDEGVGAGKYELYYTVSPTGLNKFTCENTRLECGVMIATKALKELGEEDFIKMMRFVDWLWYSDEAYDLIKWGVEGEHWNYVDDPDTGLKVKKLTDDWFCGGLGINQDPNLPDSKDLRLEYGYAGGNFWYGHTLAQVSDNFNPVIQDYCARLRQYRETKPLDPPKPANEDQNEQLNLWKTPLIDNVNTWTLQFVTGQKDIEADWDAYVASCDGLNLDQYVKLQNEVYQQSK